VSKKPSLTIQLLVGAVCCLVLGVLYGNSLAIALESRGPSRSVGTKVRGRLERGKRLPTGGGNFAAYSAIGASLGRNSVHSTVREVVLDAYDRVQGVAPGVTFVYGETGWPSGGRFRPHRTHQNGLSVDFMVPVRDASGRPARLPTWPWTRFGYGVEFDSTGRAGDLRIDFDAVAAHLSALDRAARKRGTSVELVIFAPELVRVLESDPRRRPLVAKVPFMRGRPWVRHDEHYHVDFAAPVGSRTP
jgi:penicillin-insensitive murein endopeptidase